MKILQLYQYSTLNRNSPLAGAHLPAAVLSFFARIPLNSLGVILPSPTSTRDPTMFLTICFRKPFPRIQNVIKGSSFTILILLIVLIVVFTLEPEDMKEAKSCVPARQAPAAIILFILSLTGICQEYLLKNGKIISELQTR